MYGGLLPHNPAESLVAISLETRAGARKTRGYAPPNSTVPRRPYTAAMRFVAEPISQHRLSRFHRWAMLWLAWFAAFLEQAGAFAPLSRQAEAIGQSWLDRIERIIFSIIMLRAAPKVRHSHSPIHSAQRRKGTSLRRAIIGSALRRALRPKTLPARIKALSQNLGRLVARLVKRLPRGLTRRRAIKARRTLAPALTAPSGAYLPPVADTS